MSRRFCGALYIVVFSSYRVLTLYCFARGEKLTLYGGSQCTVRVNCLVRFCAGAKIFDVCIFCNLIELIRLMYVLQLFNLVVFVCHVSCLSFVSLVVTYDQLWTVRRDCKNSRLWLVKWFMHHGIDCWQIFRGVGFSGRRVALRVYKWGLGNVPAVVKYNPVIPYLYDTQLFITARGLLTIQNSWTPRARAYI